MSPDGHIANQGSLEKVLENDPRLSTQIAEESQALEQVEHAVDVVSLEAPAKENTSGKLIVEEEIAVGHMGWSISK